MTLRSITRVPKCEVPVLPPFRRTIRLLKVGPFSRRPRGRRRRILTVVLAQARTHTLRPQRCGRCQQHAALTRSIINHGGYGSPPARGRRVVTRLRRGSSPAMMTLVSCPGRDAVRSSCEALLRRTRIARNTGVRYGLGSAAHRKERCAASGERHGIPGVMAGLIPAARSVRGRDFFWRKSRAALGCWITGCEDARRNDARTVPAAPLRHRTTLWSPHRGVDAPRAALGRGSR